MSYEYATIVGSRDSYRNRLRMHSKICIPGHRGDAKPYFAYILAVLAMVYVVYPPSLRVSTVSIWYSIGVYNGIIYRGI